MGPLILLSRRLAALTTSLLVTTLVALVACAPPTSAPTRTASTATRGGTQPGTSSSGPISTIAMPGGTSTQLPLSTASSPPALTAAPSGGGAAWQPIIDFPTSGAFEVTAVTAVADGFVAVGYGALPGEGYYGRHQGFVWHSANGRVWTAESTPAFQFVTPEQVVAIGDSVYVFGTIAMCDQLFSDECVEPAESGWAVWRSTQGAEWERLPQLEQMQFGNVDGVAVSGDSLIAYGSTGDSAQAIVWTSPDGANWTATTDLDSMTQVTAAAGTPSGVVLLGDRFSEAIEDVELVAAFAADGVNFEPATVPALVGASVRSISAGVGGLVAVGDREDQDLRLTAIALHSADGATWTEALAADGTFTDSAARFVHAVPNGYVAVGFVPTEGMFGPSTGASWLSADGGEWRQLAPFGDEFTGLNASAANASGIVAFTVTGEEPDEQTVTSTIAAWFLPH